MAKSPTKTKNAGRSIEDFRAAHDKNFIVPNKIREGLAQLGPDGWEYEVGFLKIASLSTTDLARFRDHFETYIVDVGAPRNPKRVWVGSVALAKKLREMM